MESEKVKEVKKALECIVNANAPNTTINYSGDLHLDILTLINELEEDKEMWQRKAVNYYQMAKSYGIECIIDDDIDET